MKEEDESEERVRKGEMVNGTHRGYNRERVWAMGKAGGDGQRVIARSCQERGEGRL